MAENKWFNTWDFTIHEMPEQIKRITSAKSTKTTPNTINAELQTGEFPGSGKKPYIATLDSCTCMDFIHRKLPCKHMYRLAIELDLLNEKANTGVNKNLELSLNEAVAELEKLNDKAQQEIKYFLYQSIYRKEHSFPIIFDETTISLKSCRLFDVSNSTDIALKAFKRNQMITILDEHNISGFKRNISLEALIKWCIENITDIWSVFPEAAVLTFSDKFITVRNKTYKYLHRKFDWDSYYSDEDEEMKEIYYPAGASFEDLTFSMNCKSTGVQITTSGNPSICHFPNDEITELLTKYNCNRCLNGFNTKK